MALGPDAGTLLQRIEAKLDGIYRLLELQNRSLLEASIRKITSTRERRKAWILMDGQRKSEEICRMCGTALRTVQLFVQEADRAGLMDTSRRGYPKRRYDVIPADWSVEIGEIEKALVPSGASSP